MSHISVLVTVIKDNLYINTNQWSINQLLMLLISGRWSSQLRNTGRWWSLEIQEGGYFFDPHNTIIWVILLIQGHQIAQMKFVQEKYIPNVRSLVYKHLNSVENKWFNLYETDLKKYQKSRLRMFLKEIDLRLQVRWEFVLRWEFVNFTTIMYGFKFFRIRCIR